ncbi:MAG: hypothetical protein COC08_04970 [Maribacter sp.]|nr:MAG: hypothetical protein COC08_04970 [Maribacter sp.]
MKPIFENIDVAIDSSLKIATYNHTQNCETSNWHIHPEYELVYIKNGGGILRIDNKTLPYDDGVLLLLGPNIPHADFGNKEHKNNLEVVAQFRKEFIEEKLAVFPEFNALKNLVQESKKGLLFESQTKDIVALEFEKLNSLNSSQRLIHFILILDKIMVEGHYETILGHARLNSYKSIDVDRLESIFEYVNEHYDEKISIAFLASRQGLTINSFCRFFKKMTKGSFVQFLNEFRTRKALGFFNVTQLSVSEVMYKCGYNDPSYFTRQFKKYHGTTPSGYLSTKV